MKQSQVAKVLGFVTGGLILVVLVLFGLGKPAPAAFAQADAYGRGIRTDLAVNEVMGNDWPPGETVTLTVDDPASALSPDYTGTDTPHPVPWNQSDLGVYYDLSALGLKPGFVLTMSDSSVNKTLTLVDLQIASADPAADIVSGVAPTGMQVQVEVFADAGDLKYRRYAVAGVSGEWSVDFTDAGTGWDEQAYDIRGGTQGTAVIDQGNGSSTGTSWAALIPYMQVNIDDNMFAAHDWPLGATITMTINGTDMGSIVVENYFWGWPRTAAGFNYDYGRRLQAGDVVSITDGVTSDIYTITNMQVTHIDLAADTIEGVAAPGDLVQIYGAPLGPCGFEGVVCVNRWVTVDDTGHWFADFHVPGVDPDGNPIQATLDLQTGSAGQAMDIDHTDFEVFESYGHGDATWIDWGPPWARIEASPWVARVGNLITLQAIEAYDLQGYEMTFDWDLDGDGEYDDAAGLTVQATKDQPGHYSVGLRITDSDGLISVTEETIIFYDIVDVILAPVDPVPVGTTIAASAPLTTWYPSDSFAASWRWGDGSVSPGVLTDRIVTGSHQYSSPGVYTLTLRVNDDGGAYNDLATYQYVVVYDPSIGFVTGGGWITTPPGAYTLGPALTGKATFGFVSKYQPGKSVPAGNTEFQFKTADFNFSSTSYDWLVIAGPKAQYKGLGTINGSGEYGFMLTAIDGQVNGGGGVDKFRIKIWDKATGEVVYDNQMGAADSAIPSTALGGGSIDIHAK